MSQAIRIPVMIFASLNGQTSTTVNHKGTGDRECSARIPCYGLVHKTLEIFGDAADLVAHPIAIQGTNFSEGTGNPEWADIPAPGNTITVSASIPIVVVHPSLPTIPVEPELTYLRIIAAVGGVLPRSLKARFCGLWLGVESWHNRCKDDWGI
jgi:hypothetical protein